MGVGVGMGHLTLLGYFSTSLKTVARGMQPNLGTEMRTTPSSLTQSDDS
jgi:hypothetical protein